MNNEQFEIRYLPVFKDDLHEILFYIAHILHNPAAADALLTDVFDAIQERSFYPDAFEAFQSKCEHEHPYYRIYVRNYTIYYVVIDNVMEVRAIMYNRRNASEHLK